VSERVRRLLQFNPCEQLLLEAGSWGTEIAQEPRVRGTTGEDSTLRTFSACCSELLSV
jgi:hypothetical protein